jgi:hypothetical protein
VQVQRLAEQQRHRTRVDHQVMVRRDEPRAPRSAAQQRDPQQRRRQIRETFAPVGGQIFLQPVARFALAAELGVMKAKPHARHRVHHLPRRAAVLPLEARPQHRMPRDHLAPGLLERRRLDLLPQHPDHLLDVHARRPLQAVIQHALLHRGKGIGVDTPLGGNLTWVDHSPQSVSDRG